jgi:hypothetical protein
MVKYKITVVDSEWAITERVYLFFRRVMKYKRVVFYEDSISSQTLPLCFETGRKADVEIKCLNSGALKPIKEIHYKNRKVFLILRKGGQSELVNI